MLLVMYISDVIFDLLSRLPRANFANSFDNQLILCSSLMETGSCYCRASNLLSRSFLLFSYSIPINAKLEIVHELLFVSKFISQKSNLIF